MIEQMWNAANIAGRWAILDRLGLSYKIRRVDNRLFEELEQHQQKWIINAAAVISL